MSTVDTIFDMVILFFNQHYYCANPYQNWIFQHFATVGQNKLQILASVRFFHVLYSVLPWRSVGRFNFDRGLHNDNVDSKNEKKNHCIYILCTVYMHLHNLYFFYL